MSNEDRKKLERLISENIKGTVSRNDLIDWFLKIQSDYKLSANITVKELLTAAENKKVKVVNTPYKLNGTIKLPEKRKKITKDIIMDLYIKKDLTRLAVARELNISFDMLKGLLRKYDIKKSNEYRISEEELREMYENYELSVKEIAEIKGLSIAVVYNCLKLYDIKACGQRKKDVAKDIISLRKEGKTVTEILKTLSISRKTYYKRLKEV